MDDALRRLETTDPRKGQLIEMRYFGGMTAEESSMALSIPVHVVRRELRLALAWLRKEMVSDNSGEPVALQLGPEQCNAAQAFASRVPVGRRPTPSCV